MAYIVERQRWFENNIVLNIQKIQNKFCVRVFTTFRGKKADIWKTDQTKFAL